ncbi:MAG: carboxypeptidase-like regulatory domain-containing protein [Bacteroidota bacterium]
MSLLIWLISFSQITGKIIDTEGNPLQAMVFVEGGSKSTNADKEGNYSLNLASGQYQLVAFVPGYNSLINQVNYNGTRLQVDFTLKELSTELEAVTVEGSRTEDLGISWLQSVEGTTIYEAKKTELISLDDVTANLATNTSRQVYARVPGLNIFENDGVGLQLAIGARGLDPNRSSNFNVRQNGYDISADALGYPESYYTPPVAALQRIEIIRGAAGLQYGPQFGGLLNFKFKEGPKDKKLKFTTANTAGSFGLLNTFNSFGGYHWQSQLLQLLSIQTEHWMEAKLRLGSAYRFWEFQIQFHSIHGS